MCYMKKRIGSIVESILILRIQGTSNHISRLASIWNAMEDFLPRFSEPKSLVSVKELCSTCSSIYFFSFLPVSWKLSQEDMKWIPNLFLLSCSHVGSSVEILTFGKEVWCRESIPPAQRIFLFLVLKECYRKHVYGPRGFFFLCAPINMVNSFSKLL